MSRRRSRSPATEPREVSLLLWLKVWRDAFALGGTAWSLVVLMLIGCGFFVVFAEARVNLEDSYHTFYRNMRFADASVLVDKAPDGFVDLARQLPGVTEVLGRLVKDGAIILRDAPRRRVMGRFIGMPTVGDPPLNRLYVVEGRRYISRNECVLENQFAAFNNVRIGDLVTISYQGQTRDMTVVGFGSNPEYLYPVPSKEAAWVSPQTFGVVWMDGEGLRQWLGVGREVTELHVACDPAQTEQILVALRAIAEQYGLRDSWDQAGQPSNRLLTLDLTGFRVFSVVFPILFMFAAALSLYSALSRIVRLQTGVVGFLRASGFTVREVLWHYVAQGALISAAGAVPGAVLGHLMANVLVGLYGNLLHLPVLIQDPRWTLFGFGIAMAGLVGALAAWLPARAAASTPPAVAMRGDQNQDDGTVRFAWMMSLAAAVPVMLRIAVRGLLRRPSRTLFAVGGLVCGTCVLVATLGMYVSVKTAIDGFLHGAYKWEVQVNFFNHGGTHVASAIGALPEVDHVTLTCDAPVRLETPVGTANVILHGAQRGQQATELRQPDGTPIDLVPGVIWLPTMTAKRLKVEPGDPVRAVWSYSSRKSTVDCYFTCGGFVDMAFGGFVYGEYDDVRRKMVDPITPLGSYGAAIACDEETGRMLQRRLEREPSVSMITRMGDIREQVNASMGVTFLFITILVTFGAILSGSVMHSVSTVGILERLRELATLRSLGFSARQTTWIAAVEIYVMAVIGMALGMPLGTWMNDAQMRVYETETFVFKTTMTIWVYVIATAIVLGLVSLSLRSGVKRLRTMDLAQATKARD